MFNQRQSEWKRTVSPFVFFFHRKLWGEKGSYALLACPPFMVHVFYSFWKPSRSSILLLSDGLYESVWEVRAVFQSPLVNTALSPYDPLCL